MIVGNYVSYLLKCIFLFFNFFYRFFISCYADFQKADYCHLLYCFVVQFYVSLWNICLILITITSVWSALIVTPLASLTSFTVVIISCSFLVNPRLKLYNPLILCYLFSSTIADPSFPSADLIIISLHKENRSGDKNTPVLLLFLCPSSHSDLNLLLQPLSGSSIVCTPFLNPFRPLLFPLICQLNVNA